MSELRAAAERFECVIESADFDTGTVTLKMTGKYHVAAGPWVLCRPEVAALAAEQPQPVIPPGHRIMPDWKGYALLGTGMYAINHSAPPADPELGAELMITFATEAEKSGNRQIGERRDNPPDAPPTQPEDMVIRIGFLSERAVFALEDQLQALREAHGWLAPPAAAEQPQPVGGWRLVREDVVRFLNGVAPLDGVWYGEKPAGERGAYWWRKHLRTPPPPAAAPTVTDAMVEGEHRIAVSCELLVRAMQHVPFMGETYRALRDAIDAAREGR